MCACDAPAAYLEDGCPRADDIIVGKGAELGTCIIVDTRLRARAVVIRHAERIVMDRLGHALLRASKVHLTLEEVDA